MNDNINLDSTTNMKNKSRYYFLDLLKTIAIFLVVIYHVAAFLDGKIVGNNVSFIDYLKYYLRSFMAMGVPIFFFVNGALMFNKDFDLKKHLHRMLKIIGLTIFWIIFSFIIISIINNGSASIVDAIKSLWKLKFKYNNHLWFLGTLVILYVFFPLLKLAWDKDKKIFKFFLIAIFIATVGSKLLVQIYNIFAMILGKNVKGIGTNVLSLFNPVAGINGYALVYFMLGAICFQYKEKFKNKKYNIIAIISIIISSILLCLYWILISKYTNKTIDYVWVSYDIIFTLINVISLFVICLNYKENKIFNKIIQTIGSNTMGIYLIHMIILNLLNNPLGITWLGNPIAEVMWSIIIMMVSLIISIIIKKIPIIKNSISI